MTQTKRLYPLIALVAVLALAVAAVTVTSRISSADSATGEAARLDDGKSLLPQARISIDQAISAAQLAVANSPASGTGSPDSDSPPAGVVGEIDLEDYNGTLAFNVEIGEYDVKVDSSTGDVLGIGSD
jgi:hypothetical protein